MAMPRATGRPWTLKVMTGTRPHRLAAVNVAATPGNASLPLVVSFALPEPVRDQRQNRFHSVLLVLAIGFHRDFAAKAGSQHHHPHDALGVDAALAAAHPHVAGVAAGQLGEL